MATAVGKVRIIRTHSDGRTSVTIQGDNSNETFWHPGELSDEQLAELKRAQNDNLDAAVRWEGENPKVVESVTVFGAGVTAKELTEQVTKK